MISRVARPVAAVARAARRPATYSAHVRELTSTALTAAVWPLGLADWARPAIVGPPLADSAVATPVLLIHGFGANKSNWLFLERHLRHAGFGRVEAFNYNPLAHDIPALWPRSASLARRRSRLAMAWIGCTSSAIRSAASSLAMPRRSPASSTPASS
jgi:pimeloyl-ACP methyl ester carboxylesterase